MNDQETTVQRIAYAVVQSGDINELSIKLICQDAIKTVDPIGEGKYLVHFKEAFFDAVPAVQVTAMFNGFSNDDKPSQLKPITEEEAQSKSQEWAAIAQVMYVNQHNCLVRTFVDIHVERFYPTPADKIERRPVNISFSLTAVV